MLKLRKQVVTLGAILPNNSAETPGKVFIN